MDRTTHSRHLYRLQLVATPNVAVQAFNARTKKMPPANAKHNYDRAAADGYSVKYIPDNQENLIQRDIFRLEKLELLPFNRDEEVDADEPNEEDEDDHVDTDENNGGGDMGEQNQQDDEPDESDNDETDDETDDET